MFELDNTNKDNPPADDRISLASLSKRDAFLEWLSAGNVKKFSPTVCVSCLDKISEYAVQKRICSVSLWDITQHSVYKPIYQKVLDAKLLRITDRSTYKVFIVAGQLYLKFLKMKPWSHKVPLMNEVVKDDAAEEDEINSVVVSETSTRSAIEPDEFVAWLTTQLNANGTLFLKHVARRYASNIHSTPPKLDVPLTAKERDVFKYRTVEEFDRLCEIFRNAPNYQEVNQNSDHGAFSAGLGAYRRYLEHLAEQGEDNNVNREESTPMGQTITTTKQLNDDSARFAQPYIRSSFKEWLSEQYPDWSPNTLTMHCSDAFYLFNNNRGVTLAEALGDDSGIQKAYDTIERHFTLNPTQTTTPATSARGYTRSLQMFKQFLEERFPGLLSGDSGSSVAPTTTGPNSAFAGIIDFEDGRNGIRGILNTHFQSLYGYSNINILWDAAQNLLSMFLNDNAINSADDLWKFINRAFDREFVLCAPHIWQTRPTYPQNVRGLVINLARQNGGVVTREQIDEFFTRVKINAPINSVVLAQDEMFFYRNRKFIAAESVNLNVGRCKEISKALDNLFSRENAPYIVLRDIKTEWFSCLPELSSGTNWTPLLFQEVLRVRPNIGYRTETPIIKGQDLDTLRAAILPSNSDISTFADIVHRFCYDKYKLPHRMTAEDLRLELRSAGFLEGNELIWNMHKALRDHRFAFTDENKMVMILER